MNDPAVPSWIERRTPGGEAPPARAFPKKLPRALLDRWRNVLREWGAPEAVRRSLAQLDDPETQVVVAGQQPGVWGGPLFSLYKAATAVALARRLESDGGKPSVAVFWVQADDTDWGEVGWGALPRRDLSIFRHRWNPSPVASRHWVGGGRLREPPEAEAVFREWEAEPRLLGEPRGSGVAELSRGFIDFLLGYFGGAGLLPLDSRWEELRAGGRELWVTYFHRREEIAASVASRGESMRAEGRPAPLEGHALDYGLFALDGDHRLPLDEERWLTQVEKRLERGEFSRLAPAVLLRAVLQDHLFGTACHVVGDTEGAYLEQLEPVYRALSVTPARRVPRLRATVIPPDLLPEADLREGILDPEAWIARRADGTVRPETLQALAALRERVVSGIEAVAGTLGEGQDVMEVTGAARRKIQVQINRLEEAVTKRARHELYQEDPRLRNLPEFLKPRRGPQDRGLSGASLAFFLGERAPERLLAACRRHLHAVEEGELRHFVLEGHRG